MATAQISESNQKALETAGRLQLNVLQELNATMTQLLTRVQQTLDQLEADKELIESFIAGMDSLVERMAQQIEAQIALNAEERQFLETVRQQQ